MHSNDIPSDQAPWYVGKTCSTWLLALSLFHTKLPSSTPRDLALSQVTIGVALEVVGRLNSAANPTPTTCLTCVINVGDIQAHLMCTVFTRHLTLAQTVKKFSVRI